MGCPCVIIFYDNCSTDSSAAIAKRFDKRLRYFCSKKYVGLGEARGYALAEARGKYISFLDCDNFWYKEKLEK